MDLDKFIYFIFLIKFNNFFIKLILFYYFFSSSYLSNMRKMDDSKKKFTNVIISIEYDHHDVPSHSYVIMYSKQKYPMA